METEELQNLNVHHGHNIRRTRIEKGIKQDAMSELVHLSQPAISRYERTKTIDDEILQRFARALNVPIEYLKTLEEDAPSVVFESITNDVHDNKEGVTVPGYSNNQTNAFITELYERLLKEKDEKYAALEQRIQNLEKQK